MLPVGYAMGNAIMRQLFLSPEIISYGLFSFGVVGFFPCPCREATIATRGIIIGATWVRTATLLLILHRHPDGYVRASCSTPGRALFFISRRKLCCLAGAPPPQGPGQLPLFVVASVHPVRVLAPLCALLFLARVAIDIYSDARN